MTSISIKGSLNLAKLERNKSSSFVSGDISIYVFSKCCNLHEFISVVKISISAVSPTSIPDKIIADAPISGWTDDDINNFFWFDFDTIADWLGYKDEKHFDAGVREDDVKEAQDWFDGITDTEDMINIASLDREDYISTDEDGEEEFDEDTVYYDFSNWWYNMDDIEQVKEYRKHE